MSLHVIVENRNTKMPHTGIPQQARTFTAEKADCFLFNNKGKNQPPFLPPRTSCWTWARKEPGAALAQSPLSSSLSAFAEGLEGAGIPSTNSVQIFQVFILAGLHIALGTPQELVASRVIISHLPVHQVPLPHPHLGEQLTGLPIDEVFLPRHTLILLSAPQISSSVVQSSSTAIRHRITTRRPALGNLCPSLSSSLRVRPREGTRI